MNSLLFDTRAYAETFSHMGQLYVPNNFCLPAFLREINSTDKFDVMGPWPYATPPDIEIWQAGMAELAEMCSVSFVMVARPDYAETVIKLAKAGAIIRPLKKHFVKDPKYPPIVQRKSTIRSVDLARKHWAVEEISAEEGLAEAMRQCHNFLYARRHISGIARMSDDHFFKLLELPQVTCLIARDSVGIGAMIVAFRSADETHLIHNCVAPRATKTCAGFLLMEEATERWSRFGPVYMGGIPDGVENQGVGVFKQRWANRAVDVMLVGQILNHDLYNQMSTKHHPTNYFPAYRSKK